MFVYYFVVLPLNINTIDTKYSIESVILWCTEKLSAMLHLPVLFLAINCTPMDSTVL
jgi:hypothetical protein